MGGELMKEYVGIAMRGCHESASKHPLLAFMILVLIWINRSFPTLFAFLVDASPVIASTTIILGTLLFFGQLHSPEIQKEGKPYHHKIHNLKFGVVGDTESDYKGARNGRRQKASRKKSCVVHRVNVNDNHHMVETDKLGSSIDEKFTNQKEKTILVDRSTQFPPSEAKDDDKGWETGSELAESTSPTASMAAGIIPMLHQLHHLHDHEEVPKHAHMSYLSTDAESVNSEENDHRDAIQVKDDEEKEEEDQKNLNENIIESAPVSMPRSPSDLSYDSSRQESVPVESSEPSKSNDQHHESFEVGPSTSKASKQGESGHNLGPQIVREPETPDATNYYSMNKEMDEVSDSNTSSTPDTEPIGFPLNREADSTSIKEGFNTESVASPHHEYEPDLIAVIEGNNYGDDSTSIKSGIYTESDDPSREPDLISLKEGYYEDDTTSIKSGFYPESIASTRYEDYPYPSQEADSTSVKEGFDNYEDDPSRDADLISVKDSHYEDDYTSVKDGSYAESVASVYAEDDPSHEADTNSVKEGYYASEMSDYVSQRSVSSEDDENVNLRHDGRPDEVKTNDGSEKGYQVKSISESGSPPISDINDHIDDEDEDYRSVIMPMTSHSNDQKIQEQGNESSTVSNSGSTAEVVESKTVDDSESNKTDFDNKKDDQNPKLENDDLSTVNKPNEGRFPQTFSQVQQGLTSLFKWKA